MPLNLQEIERLVRAALAEDVGAGDVTSALLIPADAQARAVFMGREPLVGAGFLLVSEVFRHLTESVSCTALVEEGVLLPAGTAMIRVEGNAQAILTGERVALNLLQRASAVATLTRRYVDAVQGTKAIILDTRKTMPGLRLLDKYAVLQGGGQNHRMRLDDAILIKDNHIALAGSITNAVEKANAGNKNHLLVEVECDRLDQVEEALALNVGRIMLDNMDVDSLRRAVALAAGRVPLEASGGVTLQTVRVIAESGVDYISVGALTHSASGVDIGLDIIFS